MLNHGEAKNVRGASESSIYFDADAVSASVLLGRIRLDVDHDGAYIFLDLESEIFGDEELAHQQLSYHVHHFVTRITKNQHR